MVEQFPYRYRLGGKEYLLIWISDDSDSKRDRFLTDSTGKILSFATAKELTAYAEAQRIELYPFTEMVLNLDVIDDWVTLDKALPSCGTMLDAWNAFSDVDSTFHGATPFANFNHSNKPLYDIVFWGSNLPAVTPQGKHYDPTWTEDELQTLKILFACGLAVFTSSVSRDTH